MITKFEDQIMTALQELIDSFGWLGIASLLLLENATGITPSEIILAAAGWMLLAAHNEPPSMIFVGGLYAALGSVMGSSVTYWVARLGGRPVIYRIARWIRIDQRYIQGAEALFRRWGPSLILFGRVVPGMRTLITIPAGLACVPFPQYLVLTFIGVYIWCTAIIGLGYFMGSEWYVIRELIKGYAPFAPIVLVLLIGLVLIVRKAIQQWLCLQSVPVKAEIMKE